MGHADLIDIGKAHGKTDETVCRLFDELWKGAPIRLLGVATSKATNEQIRQYSLFEEHNVEKLSKLDSAIDSIRMKYGEDSIKRASFVNNS